MRAQLEALKPYLLRKAMKSDSRREVRCMAYAIWLQRKHKK